MTDLQAALHRSDRLVCCGLDLAERGQHVLAERVSLAPPRNVFLDTGDHDRAIADFGREIELAEDNLKATAYVRASELEFAAPAHSRYWDIASVHGRAPIRQLLRG